MNQNNQEKWIIGTGFSRGIGLEINKLFKKNGYKIIHLGRKKSNFEDEFLPWDLIKSITDNPLSDLIQNITNKNIVGFFYSAGAMPLLKIDSQDFNQRRLFWQSHENSLQINYLSCVQILEEILPFLLKNKSDNENKFIAHMSSLAAVSPFPGFELYGITKTACFTYFKSLAAKYNANQLNCLSIHPGTVETDMINDILLNPDYKEMPITHVLQTEKKENRLISAELAASKIYDFMFKDLETRKKAHGHLYLADTETIYN